MLMQFNNLVDSISNKPGFMNIAQGILGPNLYPRSTLKHVCIVFEENGVVLHNTQQANIFIYDIR
jgi:hypothetical protein